METCSNIFCNLLGQVNWLWYVVAVLAVYVLGALWYSVLFPKAWVRIFKIEMPDKRNPANMFLTMFGQLVANALMGLALFMITPLSFWLAVLTLIGFTGWNKATLKYKYADWGEYFRAAGIEAGYLFLAGTIFIVFALL